MSDETRDGVNDAPTDYERAEEAGLTEKNRWEEGIPHHPESQRLMAFLKVTDENDFANHFDWRTGGDGDNGETLMFQMDAFFELLEQERVHREGRSRVEFSDCRKDKEDRVWLSTYNVTHSTPGRQGTTLELQLQVERGFGQTKVRFLDLEVEKSGEKSQEEALDTMANWLERAARALRQRGQGQAMFVTYADPSNGY